MHCAKVYVMAGCKFSKHPVILMSTVWKQDIHVAYQDNNYAVCLCDYHPVLK